jgi:hypothetical protein
MLLPHLAPASPHAAKFTAALILLLAIATTDAQIYRPRPLAVEPLEKEEDAPAYVWQTDFSPGMISTHGNFVSRQVNVGLNGQNIVGDAANEPSITVNPLDRNKMAVGWRQFDSVSSNFRTGGWAYTTNAGNNWIFPGALGTNFRSDPVLASDSTGTFYYLSLVAGNFDDIWRSLNGGQSWTRLGPATGGDKQWFTIDTTNSSGAGFHYQSWNAAANPYQGRQFTRSTNGGFTWMDPIYIPNGPSLGTLDVDSTGRVFIAGENRDDKQLWCVRSSDAKNAAVIPTFDLSTPLNLGGFLGMGQPINPQGLTGQANVAVDRSGTSTNDNVYVLATVEPFSGHSRADVMFIRSTNGGQTFSAPVRINDDPAHPEKWHWLAAMAVAPNGRIDAVWLDTRNATNHTDSQLFYSYSRDGGVTWSANVAVSQLFNPFLGYPNQAKMGDYIQIVSDNDGGNVAYCATFNGEQDIYYVRVAPHVPTPASAFSRKGHASGVYDISLPRNGNPGIECRLGGGANFDSHTILVTFPTAVTVGGVTVASANGLATATHSVGSAGVVTINLFAVADQQTVTVTLNNVNDGQGVGDVSIPMAVLLGDTNLNRVVNASDVAQVKAQSGQAVSFTNYRLDVNASGGFINASDIGIVKSQSGRALP